VQIFDVALACWLGMPAPLCVHSKTCGRALLLENRIGTMLPCNVIVQELPSGKVEVAAIDPAASMQAVDNPELGEVAVAVRDKLESVIEGLS